MMIIDTQWGGAIPSRNVFRNVFTWRDTAWGNSIKSDILGFYPPEHVLSLTSRRYVVWLSGPDTYGYGRMVMSEVLPDRILPPDTAMFTLDQDTEFSGAASGRRRWVVRSQTRFPVSLAIAIRTVYSDTSGIWNELPELGVDELMCTMAPLADTSAIVVYAGESGMGYGVVEGTRWTQQGNLDPRPLGPLHPRFRFRPSGGLWLLWTDRRWVHVSCYRDGQWTRGDSLRCDHRDGLIYSSAWNDLTHDAAERPVLAWGDLGVRDVGCVAFPTDSGWMPGEEIPGSENPFPTPYIARDRNGDVWAAWRVQHTVLSRWTHTYVSATTSTPRLSGRGRQRVVSWTLSEPAPESWWAVLRARGSRPFEEAARVQAGPGREMNWSDTSPPAGVLRYRIRRESVDARYRWESAEARWPPQSRRPLLLSRASPSPLEFDRLELTGAVAGSLEVRLYDLQGRLVLRQSAVAGGTGRDMIQLELSSAQQALGAGIYFAVIRDAAGVASNPLRLILLR